MLGPHNGEANGSENERQTLDTAGVCLGFMHKGLSIRDSGF